MDMNIYLIAGLVLVSVTLVVFALLPKGSQEEDSIRRRMTGKRSSNGLAELILDILQRGGDRGALAGLQARELGVVLGADQGDRLADLDDGGLDRVLDFAALRVFDGSDQPARFHVRPESARIADLGGCRVAPLKMAPAAGIGFDRDQPDRLSRQHRFGNHRHAVRRNKLLIGVAKQHRVADLRGDECDIVAGLRRLEDRLPRLAGRSRAADDD